MVFDLDHISKSLANKEVFEDMEPSTDEKITYMRDHKINFEKFQQYINIRTVIKIQKDKQTFNLISDFKPCTLKDFTDHGLSENLKYSFPLENFFCPNYVN